MTGNDKSAELDLVTIGRASVDLYGQQIGTRLEDVGSFAKSVGGCPTNIAVGTARLGLRSALVTRVGNEQMGRFIREQLAREGVETRGIVTDPDRLTALVLLAVESDSAFPMIFVRDNCADNALCEDDIDEAMIGSARAILVTGTHFSRDTTEAAQHKAIRIARSSGGKIILDIDYRPNLWGLAGHEAGGSRYIRSAHVTAKMQAVLPHCDLIVGTEEEVMIASGEEDLPAALRAIRAHSSATIVLKRGPMGCIVYEGVIPEDLEQGIVGKGFPIEVYNVLGAGDAFMSGFLRGWLRGEPHATSATWANACGAFAVSRLLCAPENPSWTELQHFLKNGSPERALRRDPVLSHIHRATNRRDEYPLMMALAIDHRSQFEAMPGATPAKISAFKRLAVDAAARVAAGRPGFGMLLDDRYGRDALFAAGQQKLWIARPLEAPGSRPLKLEFFTDTGSRLVEWPIDHCAKILCFFHPDDPEELRTAQIETLTGAHEAARRIGRDILIEVIASKHGPVGDDTAARVLAELYAAGLRPDWWKLEPQATEAGWRAIDEVIEANDPWCRGVLMLGLDAPADKLADDFARARSARSVRGFAVGRTIFADAAKAWFAGTMTKEDAVNAMADRFGALVTVWQGSGGGDGR
ncbi:5-dehydro-2-deoxygluconokinase [Arsenicitalea aurantiaca]|uniref:5-dehydro-2-deoxygluconokinase n=1 Tax=Arsenicitalea aurantiaca TaxID=1783274 RepID=A0A433X5G4_9HYPH|nr:5-dehydro-2-deoxygluconokinase [Arsenicitalea aurantiaca]RUT29288.1 5-dehydro-2-deoxygluconokinase [Arsenicitalea aurantiaca]